RHGPLRLRRLVADHPFARREQLRLSTRLRRAQRVHLDVLVRLDLEEERVARPGDRVDRREDLLIRCVVPDLVRGAGPGVAHHHLEVGAVLELCGIKSGPVRAAAAAALVATAPAAASTTSTASAPWCRRGTSSAARSRRRTT